LQPRAPWRWLSPRRLPGDVNGYGEAFASLAAEGTHRPLVLQPRAPWRWLSPRRLPGDVNGYGEAFASLAAE
ncbi:nucleoside-diphosphate sugar epimerase, partial [Stenotrophomonas sp. KAs 5-3]